MRRSLSHSLPPLAAASFALLVTGCAARVGPPEIHGRIASGGGYLGDWDFYPGTCAVRHDEVVLIEDKSSREQVRLVDRTRTPSTRNAKIDVHVERETDKGMMDLIFTDPSCVKSEMASGPRGYSGNVTLDCATGEGGHVVGKVTFQGCR
jgi:hypothetical protein